MKPKHTPAPWHMDKGQIKDAKGNSLACYPYTLGGDEDQANAALIAQAPLLLEALEKLYTAFQHDGGIPIKTRIIHDCPDIKDALNTARAAIAKAKGE
jgi:hypothetical protein